MLEFSSDYQSHINPFNELADPANVGVPLTNENDLAHHFGNALLADKQLSANHKILHKDVTATVKQRVVDPNSAWLSRSFDAAKIYLNDAAPSCIGIGDYQRRVLISSDRYFALSVLRRLKT